MALFGVVLVWLAAAIFGLHGPSLMILGVAGTGLIVGLLVLIQLERRTLRDFTRVDALTGLANHREFHERLDAALATARRDRMPVALAMLDLDGFRAVNEAHGHAYGDTILRAVGAKLRAAIRTTDLAARVGGEKFALVFYGVDHEAALTVAERIRSSVAEVPVRDLRLTCTVGVSAYPNDSQDPAALCQLADTALYWAKRGGKDRTRRFDAGHTPGERPDRQHAEVEAVLAAEEPVRAVFQPIVSLATGRLLGYESLARFPTASRGAAESWFAQAHECGLGPELEAAAIRAALDPPSRPLGAFLSLNVSPSALSSEVVRQALPDNLSDVVIEITEHEFVPDDDDLAATIAELRERGARIALDDTGAGHAGLKQLMRVRPDIVKLDRDLTDGIHADLARTALVESFVRFARHIDATVCAEGIETLEDLTALANLDVQWGQGYGLARPAPPWPAVSPAAVEACRAALEEAMRAFSGDPPPITAGDRWLVQLSAHLASARSPVELEDALGMIAAEVSAHKVVLSRLHPETGVVETVADNGSHSNQVEFAISDYPLTAQVLNEHRAAQVFVEDPAADAAETRLLLDEGERSLLMVPVVSRGESLGLLEFYGHQHGPWRRVEIDRARVIANQCSSLLQSRFHAPQRHA